MSLGRAVCSITVAKLEDRHRGFFGGIAAYLWSSNDVQYQDHSTNRGFECSLDRRSGCGVGKGSILVMGDGFWRPPCRKTSDDS